MTFMSSKRARQRRTQRLIRSAWLIAGAAVVVVLLLIALGPRPLPTVIIPTPVARPYAGEGKTLGAADAPVVFEEFSDFQ